MPVNLPTTQNGYKFIASTRDELLGQEHQVSMWEFGDDCYFYRETYGMRGNEYCMFGPFDTLAEAVWGIWSL